MAAEKRAKTNADIFQRTFVGIFHKISGAGAILIAVMVTLLLSMGALWLFVTLRESKEREAWKKLDAAMASATSSHKREGIEKVLDELSGSSAYPVALLACAGLAHQEALGTGPNVAEDRGKLLADARRYLDKFLADHGDHRMAVKARENLALVLEDSGDIKGALEAFEAAADAARDSDFAFLESKLLWGQARCAKKLGQDKQAARLLGMAMEQGRAGGGEWQRAASQMEQEMRQLEEGEDLRVPGVVRDEPLEEKAPPEDPPADEEKEKKEEDKAGEEGVG